MRRDPRQDLVDSLTILTMLRVVCNKVGIPVEDSHYVLTFGIVMARGKNKPVEEFLDAVIDSPPTLLALRMAVEILKRQHLETIDGALQAYEKGELEA